MKLSVVIVNYKVPVFLHQCLDSLEKATTGIQTEFFVVDNASNDGSIEFLRKFHPNVVFIQNEDNVGFSKANNIAIRRAKGEYVLVINPDTIVSEDSISTCIKFMDEHPDAGAAGVSQHFAFGRFAPESRRAIPRPTTAFYKLIGLCKRYPKSKRFGRYYLGYLNQNEVGEIEILSGAFMFIRREALLKVGLFDEDYFMYGEDVDLSYRILKGGYHNFYLPTYIVHYKGESTQKGSFTYVNNFNKAMTIFFRKHFKSYSWLLEWPILGIVYAKTVVDFIKISIRKMMYKPVSIEQVAEKFRFLVVSKDIDSDPSVMLLRQLDYTFDSMTIDELDKEKGHLPKIGDGNKYDFILYNTDDFSYSQIMSFFRNQYKVIKARYPSMALYHSDINKIITPSYILEI